MNAILAATKEGGIGYNGGLPWRIPQDLKYFNHVTTMYKRGKGINKLIMGRKTFESIPEKFRPFKNRLTLILSSTMTESPHGCEVFGDLDSCLEWIKDESPIGSVFLIGGSSLYNEYLTRCERVFLTLVSMHVPIDTWINMDLLQHFEKNSETIEGYDSTSEYEFQILERKITFDA
jgi:dihydrofolate reductase